MGARIAWGDRNDGPSQEDGFRIYRSTAPISAASLPVPIATLGPNAREFDDLTELSGAQYYAVGAFKGGVERIATQSPITFDGTAPAWSPISLFGSGELGAWYDPSDLSTMWIDGAGTINVASDGDVIRRIDDKSGNGWVATSGATIQPIYRTDGALHWIEFNGSTQELGYAHGEAIGDFLVGISSRETNRQDSAAYGLGPHPRSNPPRLMGSIPWGTGEVYLDAYVVPAGRITAAWPKSVGEDAVVTHARSGSSITGFESGLSLGTATEGTEISGVGATLFLGHVSSENHYAGRIYGFCTVFGANDAADRANLEMYMAAKAGITL